MKEYVKNILRNENPSHVIEMGGYTIKLFDCSKTGVNGWQKLAVCFNAPNKPMTFKTNGYGYCKTGSVLDSIFHTIGIKPKGFTEGSSELYEYHVGGNFYRVPKSKIRKYKTGRNA